MKDRLNDLVPAKRTIPTIHEHKFMRVIDEVRLELGLHRGRHRHRGLGRFCSDDLSVPDALPYLNSGRIEMHVLNS